MIERRLVRLGSGMVRDTDEGKPDFTLVWWPLIDRWARHMVKAVRSKGRDNWKLASSDDDLLRFKQSAARHFVAWLNDVDDEDHAAALLFNVAGAEYVRERLREER